jgi:serine/threonine protein kinase
VGVGGFGEVYLATMTSGGGVRTKVALKVLHHGLDPRSQAVQRLADEAKLLGLLDHPSILRIHDLILLDGRITLVTEYVAGADLDRCVADPDPLPLRGALQATAQVAEALHAAYHTDGPSGEPLRLLHRDIKPSNIRIGQHGEVKLLDFGIAKAAGERATKTQTNALIGSFTYMSPERLDKEGNDDAPGDVFALGCTLYEALAGTELFDGTIRELYRLSMDEERHQSHVEEKVSALTVRDEVKQVLRSTLAYEADDRPGARELAEQLEDLADDTPGLTLARWCRNHDWPDATESGGDLSGRTLTEMALSGATLQAQLTGEHPHPHVPRSTDTFTFDPDDPERVELPPKRSGWVVALLVLVVLGGLGLGGVALAVVGGMAFMVPWDPVEPVAVEVEPDAEGEPVRAPVVEAAHGADEGPSEDVAETPGDDGPTEEVPDQTPEDTDDDAVAEARVDGPVGEGIDRCGEVASLEPYALVGRLGASKVRCLASAMVDYDLKQVERDKLGRLLLVDARTRCDAGDCADYEAHQRTFFEEVTRSDADMLYAFAHHLADTSDDGRRAEALLFANRALELKSHWKGRAHIQHVSALHELLARTSYARFQAAPRDEKLRVTARNHAVDWMNYLAQLGRSVDTPLSLCASLEGSEESCRARAHDVGATYVVTFVSVPVGAAVFVDGQQVGNTPVQAELSAGEHEVRMEEGGETSTVTVSVDADQPTRHTWNRREGAWSSAL